MLLELYITILFMDFIIFGVAFFRKNEWMWAISLVLSALLVFSSFNIVENIAIVDNQTSPTPGIIHYDYSILTNSNTDWSLFSLALGMFLLGLLLFLNDLFMNFKEHKLGGRRF
jgi:hypothetical protein